MKQPPELLDMIDALISTPSISSVNPEYDQDNLPVIHLLANWLNTLDYRVEILPITGEPGHYMASLASYLATPSDVGFIASSPSRQLAGQTSPCISLIETVMIW